MPDDHSNTIAGATEISLGTDFSGTLDYALDSDNFVVELEAGQLYRFGFDLHDGPYSWVVLDLLNSDGQSVLEPGDATFTAMTFRPEASGTYYIAVKHFQDDDGYFSYLGDYNGHVQAIIDEYPTHAQPSDGTVDIGEVVTGAFQYDNDIDEVLINTETNGLYRVTLNTTADTFNVGLQQTGSPYVVARYYAGQSELYFVANSDDPIELSLRAVYQSYGATYSYTVERVGTDDHSALQSQATELQNGDEIGGNIAFFQDKDLFEIDVSAAATYTLTIDLTDHTSLDGLQIRLLQSDGTFTSASLTQTSTQVTYEWSVTENTTYYLHLGTDRGHQFYQYPNGNYTVSLAVEDLGTLRRGDDTDELFLGTDDAEVFVTLSGNDTVHSGKGADIVHLGDGDDVVFVGGGAEQFHGGAGHDRISYYDSLNGVNINLQTNEVSGSWASNDIISGFENVDGSRSGHDVIHGTSGANTIRTFGGNDRVYAGKGNDNVFLGNGNDYVRVGGGAEQFHGGVGHDHISYYDSRNGVNINLETNEVSGSWASNDTISGFENVTGSKTGDDTITGTSGANKIKTYGGDDIIHAGGGNDKVYAGKGSDTVNLGDGNDYVRVGGGREEFHGGNGNDYLSYYDSRNGVNINLETNEVSGSWASNDTISGFENVSGSKTGDDTITGTSGANLIRTYGGDDLIFAGDGNDTVYAGKGNDRVFLGEGNDYVVAGGGAEHFDGGYGHDIISYRDSRAGVVIDLQADLVSGSWAVNDTIKNFESAVGSQSGHNKIFGTSGTNRLEGFDGNDTLYGRDGNDVLTGRDGNDELYGGAGNDRLWGGAGNNALIGGSGADTFEFDLEDYTGGQSSHSVIRDFEDDVDTIRVYTTSSVGNDISDYARQVGDDLLLEVNSEVSLMIWDMTLAALQDDVVFELV